MKGGDCRELARQCKTEIEGRCRLGQENERRERHERGQKIERERANYSESEDKKVVEK